jgi:glycopeptide antibiotics resistance protein
VLAGALMAAYLLVVGVLVFEPTADTAASSVDGVYNLLRGAGSPDWVTVERLEFAANVALFVPLTFLGRLLLPRWGLLRWGLVGLAGSAFIETVQLLFLPGRTPTLRDVVANTAGAVLGYLLITVLWRLVRRRLR